MAQEVISKSPQSVSVTEGENANFTCLAHTNKMSISVGWRFIPSSSSSEKALTNGINLTGIDIVTVSDGLRTVLAFRGVRREVDGGMVVCRTAVARSDPATLSVQCE